MDGETLSHYYVSTYSAVTYAPYADTLRPLTIYRSIPIRACT